MTVRMQILVLVVAALAGCFLSRVGAQILPEACTCPDECICDDSIGKIDCTGQGLEYIPVEINSCNWPGIRKIDLSDNRIREVGEYALSLQSDLTHLYLYDNEIEIIDRNAFVGLNSLQFLFLDGNRIASLPSRVFRSLRRLNRLLLYSNLLTTLPFGIFAENSELTTLALHENRLNYLRTEIFDDVPLLTELYLHGNQLTDLSNSPFRSLTKLNLLYLSDNRLTRLTRFDFIGLVSLTTLLLSNNLISSVENEAFNPLQELQYLYLENNQLTEINRLMFAPPVKLLNLRVFNNRIARISSGAFFRLRDLRILSLNRNQLTEATPQMFAGLDSITELVMYDNRLTHISNDTFLQCPLMERLWLYNNEISCLEPAAFKGMTKLQTLQLGSNRLSHLPDDLFQDNHELLHLILYGNNLRTISNRLLKNLGSLVQLSISFNPIRYIAEGALEGTNNLYYIQFSENGGEETLACDCSSLWLYNWMVERPLQTSVVCGTPNQFTGHDIRSLQPASFGCSSVVISIEVGPQCDNHVVRKGDCLRLTCSSTPQGPVSWSRLDGEPIRSVPYSCSGSSTCSGGSGDEGTLLVENVTPEDGGVYVCSASFLNQTVQQICRVTVGEPPRLLSVPDDVYLAYPGPLARFSLSFTGTPQPKVQWYQITAEGSEIALHETGPASRYVMSEYGTLVILETIMQDEGRYRAVISNGAGRISVKTELFFYFENSCRAGCQNNGTCVTLHLCRCTDLYTGRYCDIYAGEEITELPPTPTSLLPLVTTEPSPSEVITTTTDEDHITTSDPTTSEVTNPTTRSLDEGNEYFSTTTTDFNDYSYTSLPDNTATGSTPDISGFGSVPESGSVSESDPVPGSGSVSESDSVSGSGSVSESGSVPGSGTGMEFGSGGGNNDDDMRGLEGLADDEDYGLNYKRQVLRERRSLARLKRPSHHRKVVKESIVPATQVDDKFQQMKNSEIEVQKMVKEMYLKEEEFETKLKEVRELAAAKKHPEAKMVPPKSSTASPVAIPLPAPQVLSNKIHLPESEPLVISEKLLRHARDSHGDDDQNRNSVNAPEAMEWEHVEHPLPEVPVASWKEKV